MASLHCDPRVLPTAAPGIDSEYLIDPNYVAARHWGLCYLDDRPSFEQIDLLTRPGSARQSDVFGAFDAGTNRQAVRLGRTAAAIGRFLAEMVGGNVSVFDDPNTFLASVLEGDLTLVAAEFATLDRLCGHHRVPRPEWRKLAKHLRPDISAKLLAKYAN